MLCFDSWVVVYITYTSGEGKEKRRDLIEKGEGDIA